MNRLWNYIALFLSIITVYAQNTGVEESFVIRKDKKLELPIADRLYFFDTPESVQKTSEYRVTYDSLGLIPDIQVNPLLPPKNFSILIPATSDVMLKHYVWLGIGNRFNTTAGYQYINSLDQKRRIHFNVNHQSLRIGPTDNAYSAENHQKLDLKIEQPIKKWNLGWQTKAQRSRLNYFGIQDSLYTDNTALEGIESNTLWKASNALTVTPQLDNGFDVVARFRHQVSGLTELYGIQENNLKAEFNVLNKISSGFSIGLHSTYHYISDASDTSGHRSMLQNSLNLNGQINKWYFKGALNLAFLDQKSFTDNNALFLPTAIVGYDLGNQQSFELGLESGIVANTRYDLYDLVPYLSESIDLKTEWVKSRWMIQYHGRLFKQHNLHISANYSSVENKTFLINDSLNNFTTLRTQYDASDIGHFKIQVSMDGSISSKLNYSVLFEMNQYYLDTLDNAYHLPGFAGIFDIHYQPSEKLSLKSQWHIQTGINYPTSLESGQIINWNLESSYEVRKNLIAFIRFNNILNQSNMRYYLYPTAPFLVTIGASFQF
jgi:hypothetical protein